jgi:hypothetical protein
MLVCHPAAVDPAARGSPCVWTAHHSGKSLAKVQAARQAEGICCLLSRVDRGSDVEGSSPGRLSDTVRCHSAGASHKAMNTSVKPHQPI